MAKARRSLSSALPLVAALLYAGAASAQAPGSEESGQATALRVEVGLEQSGGGHEVELALDGQPLAGSVDEGFQAEVPPGRHELHLRIARSDAEGGVVPYERTLTLNVPAGESAHLSLDVQPSGAGRADAVVLDVRARPETLLAADDTRMGEEAGGFGGTSEEGAPAVGLPLPFPQSVAVPRSDTGVPSGTDTGGELEPPPGAEPPPELAGQPTRPSQPQAQAEAAQPQVEPPPVPGAAPTARPQEPPVRSPARAEAPRSNGQNGEVEPSPEARIEPPERGDEERAQRAAPAPAPTTPPAVVQRPAQPPETPELDGSGAREPTPRAGRTPLRNGRPGPAERAAEAAEAGGPGRLVTTLAFTAVAAALLVLLIRRRRASGPSDLP